jgi:hypothetical protein
MIEKLELVLKFPELKPPFMGVKYEREFTGSRVNQSWVNSYGRELYQIRLEPEGDVIRVTITTEKVANRYTYVISKFNSKKIEEFIGRIGIGQLINFGHVIQIEDELKIIRTSVSNKNWVLQVNKIEFFEEH